MKQQIFRDNCESRNNCKFFLNIQLNRTKTCDERVLKTISEKIKLKVLPWFSVITDALLQSAKAELKL